MIATRAGQIDVFAPRTKTSMSTLVGNSADRAPAGPRSLPAVAWPDRTALAMGCVLAAAFVLLFLRWFSKQVHFSLEYPSDWGHAFAIPVISGYMIWRVRERILSTPRSVFWPGLAPLLLGISCYFFFSIGPVSNHMLQGFSAVLSLFGVVLLLLGPRMMRLLFLPIAYTVFAITYSRRVMIELTTKLQFVASQGAEVLLQVTGAVAGFQVERSGNVLTVIESSGAMHPMNVAEACSGLRMVIAFVALAGAVALLGTSLWWQRVALLLVSIPVAIFLNIVRVAVLGLLTLVDPGLAEGEAHTLIGTLLLIPGFGLFMLIVWVLKKAIREDPSPAAAGGRS